MGYGTSTGSGVPTTYFRMNGLKKGSKPEELYFLGTKYDDKGNLVQIDEQPTFLEGNLISVETETFKTKEDREIKKFKLTLEDSEGRYQLDSPFGLLGLNIINTIAGSKKGVEKLKLSLYTSRTDYPSLFITVNGVDEKNEWKWDYKKDFAPKIEKIKNSKGEVVQSDKSELEDFLMKEINKKWFQDKILGGKVPVEQKSQSPAVQGEEDEVDDLPF